MKYLYNITQEELEVAFGDLISYSYSDLYEPKDFVKLIREGQDYNKVYPVHITTPQQAQILLDYLSCDKSDWDYEPKLKISFFGSDYSFHRRGNYGHINQLDNGDVVIVSDYLKKMLSIKSTDIPQSDENLRQGYINLLNANETADKKIKDLERKVAKLIEENEILKGANPSNEDELPF